MSGRSSRIKGKRAETELFNLLNARLGRVVFKRNLLQSRQGGADSDTDAPVAIEVKRQEKLNLPAWLRQAREQGERVGKTPVLAYRQSRDDWKILISMNVEQFVEFLEEQVDGKSNED